MAVGGEVGGKGVGSGEVGGDDARRRVWVGGCGWSLGDGWRVESGVGVGLGADRFGSYFELRRLEGESTSDPRLGGRGRRIVPDGHRRVAGR